MPVLDLTVSIVQSSLAWENIPENISRFEKKLSRLKGGPDLVVLPEMFTTGFTMKPDRAAVPMDGEPVQWMRRMAERCGAAIAGSMIIKEKGSYYNRLLFTMPDGAMCHYDKRHLFRMGGENNVYTAGDEKRIVLWKGWRIALFVCYDLRFPVWMRNRGNDYDIALVAANWPERRISHWKTLIAARAVENQSYMLACNIVGMDGNGVRYPGGSAVVDPLGKALVRAGGRERTITARLSYNAMTEYREKFPVWKDAD